MLSNCIANLLHSGQRGSCSKIWSRRPSVSAAEGHPWQVLGRMLHSYYRRLSYAVSVPEFIAVGLKPELHPSRVQSRTASGAGKCQGHRSSCSFSINIACHHSPHVAGKLSGNCSNSDIMFFAVSCKAIILAAHSGIRFICVGYDIHRVACLS